MAMEYSYFHWAFHPWAMYTMLGLALAYFTFRKGMPNLISTAFYPILGERANGPIGKTIDILAILAPAGEPPGHRPRAAALPAPGRPSPPLRSFAYPPGPPAQLRLYPLHHLLLPPLSAPAATGGAHRRYIVIYLARSDTKPSRCQGGWRPRKVAAARGVLSTSRPTLY